MPQYIPPQQETAFEIPEEKRFEHTFVLAGSGAGKTQLLFREIIANLKRPDPPAMVIIDPKGTVLPVLSKLKYFEDNDRLVILDATDAEYPPAMNLFSPPSRERFRMYSDSVRRQIENQTIDLFSYVLATRGQPFTTRQGNCFSYLSRLMFLYEGATIDTLMDVLDNNTPKDRWMPYIQRMPANAQRWFKQEYFADAKSGGSYKTTRDQIKDRLYGITGQTECFSTTERKFDMFELLQQRKTIIVNVPLSLGEDAVELFSRYIIALTICAGLERIAIPKSEWVPTFLYMDEAPQYADDAKTSQLLHLAREYKIGVTFICQDLGQVSDRLLSALGSSTAIKYISKVGGNDASKVAKQLQISQEKVMAVRSTKTEGRFLCDVSGVTDQPVTVTFPFGEIANEETMSDEAYQRLIQQNRERIAMSALQSTMAFEQQSERLHTAHSYTPATIDPSEDA